MNSLALRGASLVCDRGGGRGVGLALRLHLGHLALELRAVLDVACALLIALELD